MMRWQAGHFMQGTLRATLLAAMLLLSAWPPAARAQDPAAIAGVLGAGDAVVTGFSGTLPPPDELPPGADPLQYVFIDPAGASMQIERIIPNGPPAGQLIESPALFSAPARDVGQVFAVTLDDAPAPAIYLGATSAFGIHIVAPDEAGAVRHVKQGGPGVQFMEGQWGTAKGGAPGSIYRVDGVSGEISLFTTIGSNAGPGLGDVVFDRASRQFFASDLDTGLIYRLDFTGLIIDSFDHGVAARPVRGDAPLPDDGSSMDIASPAFNSEDPASWGLTAPARRIGGMAVHGGRLYYAVAEGPEVWSVGIGLDGAFHADARWELDVGAPASADAVTDIVFDSAGRMILAQRGNQRGSFDYSVFAEPKTAAVLRYAREIPDDTTTPGRWAAVADEYAIGFRPELRNADGGVALGYGYDASGAMRAGSCNAFLWSTGEALRDDPALAAQLAAGGPAIVDGLQGNDATLVKPANAPPFMSYFTDYDENVEHPERQGWMGDVEIYQPCAGGTQGYLGYPGYLPPPVYLPPGGQWTPSGTFNLTLEKIATPEVCLPGAPGWLCYYTIRVTNTGTVPYWGPLTVRDWMPGLALGAIVNFDFQPPWMCGAAAPFDYQCTLPGVFLAPGDGVDLYVSVAIPVGPVGPEGPANPLMCYAGNGAEIMWWDGFADANPWDDAAYAEAQMPNEDCLPQDGGTNLRINKRALSERCALDGGTWGCEFLITVTNTGPGVYTGPLEVIEEFNAVGTIAYAPQPNPPAWSCMADGAAYSCTHAPVTLNPGESVPLWLAVLVPAADHAAAGRCSVVNRAHLLVAPGGSPMNLDPADDNAEAEIMTPGPNCEQNEGGHSDLSLQKLAMGCSYEAAEGGFVCGYQVAVTNQGPDVFAGVLTIREEPALAPGEGLVFMPPWNCVASGTGFDCTADLGATPLAPGASAFMSVWKFIPSGSQVCEVRNQASILAPAAGSDANADGGNDASGVVVQAVPSPECNPPPEPHSNLTIAKRALGCEAGPSSAAAANQASVVCGFEVTLQNAGPDAVGGIIAFQDQPTGAGTPSITAAPPGWACGNVGLVAGCGFGGGMAPGASASFTVTVTADAQEVIDHQCQITNRAWIAHPLGAPLNSVAADDIAEAVGEAPGLCAHLAVKPVNACPPERQMPDKGCCPDGQTWNGRACSGGPSVTKQCPAGTEGTYPDCTPLVVTKQCPRDSVGTYPNCVCRKGSVGTPGKCRKRECPSGTSGTWPNCSEVVKRCPAGTHGKWPNCEANVCPKNTTGKWPNCVEVVRRCPPGTHGKWPKCEANVCPKNTTGKWPNCVEIVRRCPPGTHGKWPNCEANVCPKGTVGKWPNCVRRIKDCPPGTHGKWPNCEANTCPPGTRGKWPNCRSKPNTNCPDGMVYSRSLQTCVKAKPERKQPQEQPEQPKLRAPSIMITPDMLKQQ